MENNDDLKSRLRDISDKISHNRISASADAHRLASSSIGSETPLTTLVEIREGQTRILEEIKSIGQIIVESDKRQEERHRDLCKILLVIAESNPPTRNSPAKPLLEDSVEATDKKKSQCYYGAHAISNYSYLMGCILMHMDLMLQSHPRFKKIKKSDSTYMDVKQWYTVCNNTLNADKSSKASLRIPKPAEEDFKSALRIVASPVMGRRPNCDSTHLCRLLEDCGAIMTTVEWIRKSILKCPGIISPERTCRFRSFEHPFISEDSELLVEDTGTLKMPTPTMHKEVSEMKESEKKEYMRMILSEGRKAVDSMSHVKSMRK